MKFEHDQRATSSHPDGPSDAAIGADGGALTRLPRRSAPASPTVGRWLVSLV